MKEYLSFKYFFLNIVLDSTSYIDHLEKDTVKFTILNYDFPHNLVNWTLSNFISIVQVYADIIAF